MTDVKASPAKKLKTDEAPISIPASPKFTTNMEFIRELVSKKAESMIPNDGRIFVAQRTDKITEVWKGLLQHNFLSVPVLQKTGAKYYGFVDQLDILVFVINLFGEAKLNQDQDFWASVANEDILTSKTVNDVMVYPLSLRNPFHPVSRGYSLFTVVELLAKEKGLHRVPIIDEQRRLMTMISQSQIVNYLASHMDKLGSIRSKPVTLFSNFSKEVVKCTDDIKAIDAFKLMIQHNVSGIAIVNAEGKIDGSLALRDLKAISYDGRLFWRLHQTVKNFIQKLKHEHDDRPRGLVVVHMTDTLETVVKLLTQHHIHRVFIVDENKKPIGVVSLKDVLYEIITNV